MTYLWGCITGTATSCLERLTFVIHIAQAKVNDFELPVEVQEQVFGFEVSMTHAKLVNVVHTSDKLLEMLAGCAFLQFLVLDN